MRWPRYRPWRDRDGKLRQPSVGNFIEWDRANTRLGWDAKVRFDGDDFEVNGGSVIWWRKRWWMRFGARRIVHDQRLASDVRRLTAGV